MSILLKYDFLKKINTILIFLFFIISCSFIIKNLLEVKNKSSTNFTICTISQENPKVILLRDYIKRNNLMLCQGSLAYRQDNSHFFELNVIESNDNYKIMELIQNNNNVADPQIYKYKIFIENNRVEPIWHKYGGNLSWIASVIASLLILLTIVLLKNYIQRKK